LIRERKQNMSNGTGAPKCIVTTDAKITIEVAK
jgi:hypothetical protein